MTNIIHKTGAYVRKARVRAGNTFPKRFSIHPKAIRPSRSGRAFDPVAYAAALEVLG